MFLCVLCVGTTVHQNLAQTPRAPVASTARLLPSHTLAQRATTVPLDQHLTQCVP